MLLSVILVALCSFAVRGEDSEPKSNSSEGSNENVQQQEKYVEVFMNCSAKYQVPPNYFTMILNGDAPVYDDAKCFVKCTMMGLNYLGEDGSFNDQVVREVVERFFPEPAAQEQAINAWLTCEKQSHSELYADDSCDRAYSIFKCYSDNLSKAYFVAQP